jgi:DNA-directed RNA polymerase specialized sigma24 family protein
MASILDLFLDRKTNRACSSYPSHEALFAGLAREEAGAIRCLSARISGRVFNIGKRQGLAAEDIEELICDCIVLLLQKIRSGKYVFQGFDPATFGIEIAKKRVNNFRRQALKHEAVGLELLGDRAGEPDYAGRFETELLEKLLDRLDEGCRDLIRLKYLEERRDKEVIEQKLTRYATVDTLKNQRSKCMKKLVDLAYGLA